LIALYSKIILLYLYRGKIKMKKITILTLLLLFLISCKNITSSIEYYKIQFINNSDYSIYVVEFEGETFPEFTIEPNSKITVISLCPPYYFSYAYDNKTYYYDSSDYMPIDEISIMSILNDSVIEFRNIIKEEKIKNG
jgi:hypothetical protein